MIREDRDPGFWVGIASHPGLAHVRAGQDPSLMAYAVQQPRVVPLRAEHGGFVFLPADSFGRAYELHTLFTPDRPRREPFDAAREAFDHMFGRCDLILTHQTPHPQSLPPKTFRFAPLGDFHDTPHGPVRLWMLTRDAWLGSPARRR